MAHDPYAALRVKNYRRFIVSTLTMTLSSQIQGVVVAWQIYAITHDPLSLGLMGLAEALPFIGVALFAGHVADRFSRHRISIASLARAARLLAVAPRVQPDSGIPAALRRAAVLRRDLRERHRAQLPPAGAQGARRRDRRPQALRERGCVAIVDVADRRRWSDRRSAGLIYGFSSPRVAYVADAIMMIVALVTFSTIDYAHRPVRDVTRIDR